MKPLSLIGGCVIAATFCVAVFGQETAKRPNEIPLNEIWAWKMPGTKDAGELDAVKIGQTTENPIVADILSVLVRRPARDEKAGPAFVVEGVGKEALRNAQAIFKKDEKPSDELPANTDLSLVFYSHNSGQWVQLVSVGKSENAITLKYRFVGHATANNTNHFALIPIGTFKPGVVDVKIEQQKSLSQFGAERPTIPELERRLVSKSFSFKVRK